MKKKKPIPPKAKITDAKNGEIKIWTTKNTTPGKYQLVLEAPEWMKENGNNPIILNVEVL